jgi:hypothetical protein
MWWSGSRHEQREFLLIWDAIDSIFNNYWARPVQATRQAYISMAAVMMSLGQLRQFQSLVTNKKGSGISGMCFRFHWRNSLLSVFHCCSVGHTPEQQLANPRSGKWQKVTDAIPHQCSRSDNPITA